jgi:hypothetical protein
VAGESEWGSFPRISHNGTTPSSTRSQASDGIACAGRPITGAWRNGYVELSFAGKWPKESAEGLDNTSSIG